MKILVIGGGMSGLTYAIVSAALGNSVTVAERNPRVGKKIAMTGNGKCNVGNAHVDATCYNKSNIVKNVLSSITVAEYRDFLKSCGIHVYEDAEGRLYPLSDSASNVVDCLRYRLERLGGKLLVGVTVTSCTKVANGYEVILAGNKEFFNRVVLACGSGSQAIEPDLSSIVDSSLLTKRYPSLVPVKVANMDGVLNGIRVKANVTLLEDGKAIAKESGEVLFKDYGLSGICIFNLSALIARAKVFGRKSQYTFAIDLVPHLDEAVLANIIAQRLKTKDKLFYGVLHNKVAECVVKRCANLSNAKAIAQTAKCFTYQFDKLLDWSMSQVTAGGIDEKHIDPTNLTLSNGIVVLGEILNVDGICGGNNLYFASASALYTFSQEERRTAYAVHW